VHEGLMEEIAVARAFPLGDLGAARVGGPERAALQESDFSLAHRRDYDALLPNGFSIDGLCGVISSAPFSVMNMSSSRRTPNSPRM